LFNRGGHLRNLFCWCHAESPRLMSATFQFTAFGNY
jgi:hypothetical protein